jgi:phenylalanyl-tRNA synthetase beta chain
MPTVTLNRKEVDKLLGKKLEDSYMKDRISMLGTDLESVNEEEIVVEVFPNRPDMLSEQGFARALKAFIDIESGLKHYKVNKSDEKVIVDKSVAKLRPYTAFARVTGIDFDDDKLKQIIQLQEKLHGTYCRKRKKASIGIYPCEHVKSPITYKMMPREKIFFHPLQAEKEMTADEILKEHPTGAEFAHIIDEWKEFPCFIDANGNIMSLVPIINSNLTGRVTTETKDVYVECTGTSKEDVKILLNILVTSLVDMGGSIHSVEIDYGDEKEMTPNLNPGDMKLDINYVNKILGLGLAEKDIKKLLGKMGFGLENGNAKIPAYRADILHQIDLVEEIGIAYGYENFIEEIPKLSTIANEDKFDGIKRKIAEILAGLGFIETNNYHLTDKAKQTNMMETRLELVELKNSLSADYNSLRAWLIPELLETLKDNKTQELPYNVFTMGRVFKPGTSEVIERERLAIMMSPTDFTKIKQILEYLMKMLDLQFQIEETKHPSFIEGRVGRVIINEKEVAYIGEISPKVLENWGIINPVACLELNLSEIFTS